MRLHHFRHMATGVVMALLVCLFPASARAKRLNILMFMWQGETGTEKGFKEALSQEFTDQNINYVVVDAYKDVNRLKDLIDQTDQTQYQLIYTYGSTITSRVAKAYTKTPIVFNKVLDPIGYRIIESWDSKQKNLTGVSIAIPTSLQIELMHKVFGAGNIGLIYSPTDKGSMELKEEMEAILEKKGMELIPFEFTKNFTSLSAYVDRIAGRVSCIYLPTDRDVVGYIERIFSTVNRRQVPTCMTSTSVLERGGTLCLSVDYVEVGKMAGKLAAKILKGIPPADLPVMRPTEAETRLYANSYVLKKLKMELPKELNIQYLGK
ncbi:MAG: ABC transporter substrate-binding protein [bacterium]